MSKSKCSKWLSPDQLTKKKKREYDNSRRGSWGNVNPVSRVVQDATKYNRKKIKKITITEIEYD